MSSLNPSTKLYRETPCMGCGELHLYEPAFSSHGEYCEKDGGSREEVTIDYEAAARLGVVWVDLTEKQKVARIAYVTPTIDTALKSAGFTMTFASEKGA